MRGAPLRFMHIGMDYVICANRVVAVLPSDSEQSKRIYRLARTSHTYIDMTRGRSTKAYLMMEDGMLIGTPFNPKTVQRRLMEEPDARVSDGVDLNEAPWMTMRERYALRLDPPPPGCTDGEIEDIGDFSEDIEEEENI